MNDFPLPNQLDQDLAFPENRPPLINREVINEYVELIGPDGGGSLSALIDIYISTSPDMLALMEKSLAGKNLRNLQRAAHTLKSSCASLGAQHLSDLCRNLEYEARTLLDQGQNPEAAVYFHFEQEVTQIKVEFNRACTELDRIRGEF